MENNDKQAEQGQLYELSFLLTTGESDARFMEVLKEHGAEIVFKGPITQIQLAYPIKKQPSAEFGYVHLRVSDTAALKQITNDLQLKEFVIRFLFVKVPKVKKVESSKEVAPAARPVAPGKTPSASSVTRLDSLTNEKLEETLEEILK